MSSLFEFGLETILFLAMHSECKLELIYIFEPCQRQYEHHFVRWKWLWI